jgi:hypothetical protein
MYTSDLDKIRTNANIIYQQIQMEFGIEEKLQQDTANAFDKWMAESAADTLKAQQEADANGDIFKKTVGIASFIGGVLMIVLSGGALAAPGAALAGAGVAAMG